MRASFAPPIGPRIVWLAAARSLRAENIGIEVDPTPASMATSREVVQRLP
jgi:hypothetical protein